jgi:hypothetical protein
MATDPLTARPTPTGGPQAPAAMPPTAAGATPACDWCGDLGLLLVGSVCAGRVDWSEAKVVDCLCRAPWSPA